VAGALNESLDAESAIASLLPHLEDVLGLRTAWTFRYDETRRRFVEVAATGLPPALAWGDQEPLRAGSCECQRRFRRGELNRPVNMVHCSRLESATGDTQGLVVHASVPLTTRGRRLGILNVAAPGEGAFGPAQLDLLAAVGNQVAVAIHRSVLYARERRRAERLAALTAFVRELPSGNPGEVGRRVLPAAKALLDFPRLFLIESQGKTGRIWAGGGPGRIPDRVAGWSPDPRAWSGKSPSRVLSDSRSGRIARLQEEPPLYLVAESPVGRAFDAGDEEVLDVLALHLRSSLERGRRQASERHAAVLEERQRIAAELHDAVSQRLFSAILNARAARIAMAAPGSGAEQPLIQVEAQIASAQREMRALIDTLRRPAETDIHDGLSALVAPLRPLTGVRVTFRSGAQPLWVPYEVGTAVLRVAEEAVHNALRHSGASRLTISLHQGTHEVRVSVTDNGRGLAGLVREPGHGLDTMTRRAQQVGARLTIHSAPAHGTRVVLRVPREVVSDGG
jgi:signal transduction histidine kinase